MTFQLVFPSQETFLVSNSGRVDVYVPDVKTPDEICRNLSAGLAADEPGGLKSTTGELGVCDLSGSQLEDVPVGRVVFFADIQGGVDRISIIRGCTVADVYANNDDTVGPVRIQLSTLPTYPDDPEVLCADTDAKCEDFEPCLAGG